MALRSRNYSQEKGELLNKVKAERSSPSLQKLKAYIEVELEDTIRKLLRATPETVETLRQRAAVLTELNEKIFG